METTIVTGIGDRVRCWSFTINNYCSDDIAQMTSIFGWPECSKYAAQEEVGKEGTPHINGYFYFPGKMSWGTLMRAVPRMYLRKSYKCAKANQRYCSKDETHIGMRWLSHPDRPIIKWTKPTREEFIKKFMDFVTKRYATP